MENLSLKIAEEALVANNKENRKREAVYTYYGEMARKFEDAITDKKAEIHHNTYDRKEAIKKQTRDIEDTKKTLDGLFLYKEGRCPNSQFHSIRQIQEAVDAQERQLKNMREELELLESSLNGELNRLEASLAKLTEPAESAE